MTQPKTSSGWAAECYDCPYTVDEYGAHRYPRSESAMLAAVENWAKLHSDANPGHKPQVGQYQRFTMDVTNFSPEVLRMLFGGAGAGAAADVDDQGAGGQRDMIGRIPDFDE